MNVADQLRTQDKVKIEIRDRFLDKIHSTGFGMTEGELTMEHLQPEFILSELEYLQDHLKFLESKLNWPTDGVSLLLGIQNHDDLVTVDKNKRFSTVDFSIVGIL
jgi:hypothetical protein